MKRPEHFVCLFVCWLAACVHLCFFHPFCQSVFVWSPSACPCVCVCVCVYLQFISIHHSWVSEIQHLRSQLQTLLIDKFIIKTGRRHFIFVAAFCVTTHCFGMATLTCWVMLWTSPIAKKVCPLKVHKQASIFFLLFFPQRVWCPVEGSIDN